MIYFKQSAACSQACNLCPKVGAQLISLNVPMYENVKPTAAGFVLCLLYIVHGV